MVAMRPSNAKLRGRATAMVREFADVDAAAAESALDCAEGDIRLAVLIALGLPRERAATLLGEAGGNLRTALRAAEAAK